MNIVNNEIRVISDINISKGKQGRMISPVPTDLTAFANNTPDSPFVASMFNNGLNVIKPVTIALRSKNKD